jgi:hypothetical protein
MRRCSPSRTAASELSRRRNSDEHIHRGRSLDERLHTLSLAVLEKMFGQYAAPQHSQGERATATSGANSAPKWCSATARPTGKPTPKLLQSRCWDDRLRARKTRS